MEEEMEEGEGDRIMTERGGVLPRDIKKLEKKNTILISMSYVT